MESLEEFSASIAAVSMAEIDRTRLYLGTLVAKGACDAGDKFCVEDRLVPCLERFRRAKSFDELRNAYDELRVFSELVESDKPVACRIAGAFLKQAKITYEEWENREPSFLFENVDRAPYPLNLNGTGVLLSVRLKAQVGLCPPVESVIVRFYGEDFDIARPLEGRFCCGDEVEFGDLFVPIRLKELESGGGEVKVHLAYTNYHGEKFNSSEYKITYKLQFVEPDNPYKIWVQHVADEKIFVGRRKVLGEMLNSVKAAGGGLGFMIQGQRKMGKSSVLAAFCREVKDDEAVNCFVSELNLLGDAVEFSNLSRMFVDRVGKALESADLIDETWRDEVGNGEFRAYDMIMAFSSRIPSGKKWCLVVDEFTEIYDDYRRRGDKYWRQLVDFLKLLKRLVDGKVFHIFVVVQNSIVGFKKEFGELLAPLGKVELLGGLDVEEIGLLVDKLDPDHRRIRPRELDRIFEYTGGNPLLTLYLLSRIPSSMKKKLSFTITRPVIADAVSTLCKPVLISGRDNPDCLQPTDFQMFFKLGLQSVKSEHVLLEVYRRLACDATPNFSVDEMFLLDELSELGIVEKDKTGGRYGLRAELFAEWLRRFDRDAQHQKLTLYDFGTVKNEL